MALALAIYARRLASDQREEQIAAKRCTLGGAVIVLAQPWCEGGKFIVFWWRLLGCLSLEPGPDKNHNDLYVTCEGSWVDGVES